MRPIIINPSKDPNTPPTIAPMLSEDDDWILSIKLSGELEVDEIVVVGNGGVPTKIKLINEIELF